MSFIKITRPDEYKFDDPPVQMLKLASQPRTVGRDYQDFKKRAGIFDFEKIVNSIQPGEVPIHVIALGCDECFGPNRNGDAFTKEACRNFCHTFVKYGRWFREHDHKDRARSYGVVKLAAFNEGLGRIELIVALNGTKEAARRNGGLIADRELEALNSGKDLGTSMACKVAYDVCSGCGNRARSRDEYCGPVECTKYGGLRFNLGKTFDDGHILRAFNPEPKWFDISYVAVPADRIAFSTGKISLDDYVKHASAPDWLYELSPQDVAEQIKILTKLAYVEDNANEGWFKTASAYSWPNYHIKQAAEIVNYRDTPEAVWELSRLGIVLGPEDFLLSFGNADLETAVKVGSKIRAAMPYIFNRMLNKQIFEDLRFNIFYPREPVVKSAIVIPEIKQGLLYKTASDLNRGTYRTTSEFDSQGDKIKKLAETYALYQIGSICYWKDTNLQDELIRRTIVLNRAN